MRVVDRTTSRNYLKYLNKAKTDYTETNERIASGHRFEEMNEDVAAGTRVLRARVNLTKANTQLENVESVMDELGSCETTMRSINDIIQSAYGEKIVAAMSEEKGESGRLTLANEISSMKRELLQFANARYTSRFLFGGSNASDTPPFTVEEGTGKLLYNGIDVEKVEQKDGTYYYHKDGSESPIPLDSDVYIDIGLGIKMNGADADPMSCFGLSYSGLSILGFGKPEDGNGNIYNLLNEAEKSIRENDQDTLSTIHKQLGNQYDNYRSNLTNIGADLQMLNTMKTRLEHQTDTTQSTIKRLMGVDDAKEASQQTMNDYVLKAVIQMGSRLLPVSLMDYLR